MEEPCALKDRSCSRHACRAYAGGVLVRIKQLRDVRQEVSFSVEVGVKNQVFQDFEGSVLEAMCMKQDAESVAWPECALRSRAAQNDCCWSWLGRKGWALERKISEHPATGPQELVYDSF